jgi:hypothetical protein
MLVSAPAAWFLAHRAVHTQGVGPIDFTSLSAEEAEAEVAAKQAAAAADAKKGEETDGAEKGAGH